MPQYIRGRDEELLHELGLRINNERLRTQNSIPDISAKGRMSTTTVQQLIHTGRGTVTSLLRIADAMDCEIILSRRLKIRTISEIEGAEERLFKIHHQQLKQKNDKYYQQKSKRREFDRAEWERDFLTHDNTEQSGGTPQDDFPGPSLGGDDIPPRLY